MMAWIFSTRFTGLSRSVSRVPGAPPRTSTPAAAPLRQRSTVHPVRAWSFCAWPTSMPGTSVIEFLSFIYWRGLFQFAHQFEKFLPLFIKEMHSHVIQFDVIGHFTVRLFHTPGEEIFGLRDGFGLRFVIVIAHENLLGSDRIIAAEKTIFLCGFSTRSYERSGESIRSACLR